MKKIYALFLLAILSACANEIDRTPGHEYHFYDQEAFVELSTAASSQFLANLNYLTKWNKQIRIRIEGNQQPQDMSVVVDTVRELTSFLPLNVVFVNEEPNFVIFFGSSKEIENETKGRILRGKSFFVKWPDKTENTYAFKAYISDDLKDVEERRKSLVCSVLSGVGFVNPTRRFTKGCFSAYYNDDVFNEHDREMLKLLYRSEFKSGMISTEIREVFKTIKRPL